MSVTPEVFHDAGSILKRRLTVHHPLLLVAQIEQALVNIGHLEFQQSQELSAEFAGKHSYRQKELFPRRLPFAQNRQSTGRNNAVDMRMKAEILTPGMQNGCMRNRRAEIFLIFSQFLQSLRYAPEQQIVAIPLVAVDKRIQFLRDSKHNVKIANFQKIGLLSINPPLLGKCLALRAMPVTT